jgi:hypothetical protein
MGMKDADFKKLAHPVGRNVIASRGSAVSTGYKPDITVRNPEGKLLFILEPEQKTDRKAFLGDLIKAEMYSEQQKSSPELIIVMQPFDNTTTQQIADHIRPYKNWLAEKKGGTLSISSMQVLSDDEYIKATTACEELGSLAFRHYGHIV